MIAAIMEEKSRVQGTATADSSMSFHGLGGTGAELSPVNP